MKKKIHNAIEAVCAILVLSYMIFSPVFCLLYLFHRDNNRVESQLTTESKVDSLLNEASKDLERTREEFIKLNTK